MPNELITACRDYLREPDFTKLFGVPSDSSHEYEMSSRFANLMRRFVGAVFDYRDSHGTLGLEEGQEPRQILESGMEGFYAWLKSRQQKTIS